ncbi:hypothetical protein HDV04_003083 [Boothiomyces sp. JEL0838]|nr:hypothetical protein HDV04_003083 [Boothiomyces sp. JEL0838]
MAWNGLMCLSNILHEVLNLSLMASLNKLVMKMHNGALSMSSQSKPEQSKIGEPGDILFSNSAKTMGPPEKDMHAIAERRRSVFVNGRSLKNALLEEESRLSEIDKPSVKMPTSTSMRQIPGLEIEQRMSVSTRNASLRISVDTNHSGPKIDSAGITAEGSPKKSPHQDEQKTPTYHGEDSPVNPFQTSGSRRATINTFQPARTSDRGSSFDDYRKRFSVLQPAKEERIDEGSVEPATNTSVTTRKKRERRVTLDSKVTNPMEMLTKIELLKQSAAEEQSPVKDVPDNNQIEYPAEQKESSLINPRKNISEQSQPSTLDLPPDSNA